MVGRPTVTVGTKGRGALPGLSIRRTRPSRIGPGYNRRVGSRPREGPAGALRRPALALTDRRPATVHPPTPEDLRAESEPDLVDIIRARIEAGGGRITFADFMELALYHPEHGYYLGPTVRAAREGDFLTAAEL